MVSSTSPLPVQPAAVLEPAVAAVAVVALVAVALQPLLLAEHLPFLLELRQLRAEDVVELVVAVAAVPWHQRVLNHRRHDC
jgi:hypothetical protein